MNELMNKNELFKNIASATTDPELFSTIPFTVSLLNSGDISEKEFVELVIPAWLASGDKGRAFICALLPPNSMASACASNKILCSVMLECLGKSGSLLQKSMAMLSVEQQALIPLGFANVHFK
jgi:hypothetical protein